MPGLRTGFDDEEEEMELLLLLVVFGGFSAMEVVAGMFSRFLSVPPDDVVGDGILDWRKSKSGIGGGTLPLSEGSVLALPSTLLATPASDS